MISLELNFEQSILALGTRSKQLRRRQKITQDELAVKAGVGVATIRRFEKTGNASLENVLRIATALNVESGFYKLFESPAFASLDEALETET
jgi:transcriptional regulator with XRE-family HTH domain